MVKKDVLIAFIESYYTIQHIIIIRSTVTFGFSVAKQHKNSRVDLSVLVLVNIHGLFLLIQRLYDTFYIPHPAPKHLSLRQQKSLKIKKPRFRETPYISRHDQMPIKNRIKMETKLKEMCELVSVVN